MPHAHPANVEPTIPRNTGGVGAFVKLLRPKQWAKSAFVLIGPLYGWGDSGKPLMAVMAPALAAAAAFALVSSACYIVNDIADAPRDRLHPRKAKRPIASGAITPKQGLVVAAALCVLAAGVLLATMSGAPLLWVGGLLAIYAANVSAYSALLKHVVIADVMCLALGFVLRVLGGCAAAVVVPSTWLLNCTLFLAMFLAFGKRLGERRTMGGADGAAAVRGVQATYTDELLRMSVVVTAVATLVTYAGYVQAREKDYTIGFNLLWLTVLPATLAMFRAILVLERGLYDDPTEIASRDRMFQFGAGVFVIMSALLLALVRHTS